MVVITQRDKTKGLQHAVGSFARCFENLSHTLDRAGFRLKSDFDKIALSERTRQAEKATGH